MTTNLSEFDSAQGLAETPDQPINLETEMDGRKRTQRAQRKDFEKKALLTEWVSA